MNKEKKEYIYKHNYKKLLVSALINVYLSLFWLFSIVVLPEIVLSWSTSLSSFSWGLGILLRTLWGNMSWIVTNKTSAFSAISVAVVVVWSVVVVVVHPSLAWAISWEMSFLATVVAFYFSLEARLSTLSCLMSRFSTISTSWFFWAGCSHMAWCSTVIAFHNPSFLIILVVWAIQIKGEWSFKEKYWAEDLCHAKLNHDDSYTKLNITFNIKNSNIF